MIELHNKDCLRLMGDMSSKSVDFILTDIPYGEVNRKSSGLRNINKGNADICNFDLEMFLTQCERVCRGSICIFCGMKQFSTIYEYFSNKQGTVRCIVWKKTNPSPMNGKLIYLSGAELCVWFKPKGWKIFNGFCKSNVFEYSCGGSKIHPTQKNIKLFLDLIQDNTVRGGGVVFDPCMGSGTTGVACKMLERDFIGCEIDENYYKLAKERIDTYILQPSLF